MSLSELPLSYCTNVHPGRTVAEVEAGMDRYTVPIARAFGRPLAAGLWLANAVVGEMLAASDGVARFAEGLRRRGLSCHTLNAFPFGDFHDTRVKERVYLPDWTQPQRLVYTEMCAAVLAALLPEGVEGSISTVPLGFKGFAHPPDFIDAAARQIIECARGLDRLRARTGRLIRLAIEPEPLCVLETTAEAIEFFRRLWMAAKRGGDLEIVQTHIGLCYDVCHQAVEFEDISASINALAGTGVRINKVHISCSLQLDNPAGNTIGREALLQYVEPRYLHQTLARLPGAGDEIVREIDLTEQIVKKPSPELLSAPAWRVHFHVPVNADRLGPLATTRPALREALAAVAVLDYPPHLEVETYTWEVLPGTGPADLVAGLTRELTATEHLLSALRAATD
jgi:sugar phosphate isomerase/epimerase